MVERLESSFDKIASWLQDRLDAGQTVVVKMRDTILSGRYQVGVHGDACACGLEIVKDGGAGCVDIVIPPGGTFRVQNLEAPNRADSCLNVIMTRPRGDGTKSIVSAIGLPYAGLVSYRVLS